MIFCELVFVKEVTNANVLNRKMLKHCTVLSLKSYVIMKMIGGCLVGSRWNLRANASVSVELFVVFERRLLLAALLYGRLRTGIFFKKTCSNFFFFKPPTGRMKVGMTSSRYGLYKLGYMFATMRISILGPSEKGPRRKCSSQYRSLSAIWNAWRRNRQ